LKRGLSPLAYEFKKIAYCLLWERQTLRGFWQAMQLIPRMRHKRRVFFSKHTPQWSQLEKWFD
jgi:hypothetical protein